LDKRYFNVIPPYDNTARLDTTLQPASVSHRGGVVVLGAGGHAKVVISTLRAAGEAVDVIYDDNSSRWGKTLRGIPIRGPISALGMHADRPAVIAVGDNAIRQSIAGKYPLRWITAVHPRACVDPTVELGAGTVVFAGAIIQPDSRIGAHAIVNTGATVDHDCQVHDFVHVGPGVHLAGGVRVSRGATLGTGCVAIAGVTIGENTTIGAAAAVIRDVPANVVAVGVPAHILRSAERAA
jgi:sugar O-acyltransferase (sialic acid O-acetyltransferase NeuD family)